MQIKTTEEIYLETKKLIRETTTDDFERYIKGEINKKWVSVDDVISKFEDWLERYKHYNLSETAKIDLIEELSEVKES